MQASIKATRVFTLGIVLVLSSMVCAEPRNGPELVMHGPVNSQAMQPCGDECLCLPPPAPQLPHLLSQSKSQLTIGFGKTSVSSVCDAVTLVQMESGMDGQWITIYNGPARITSAKNLRSDETIRFRIREQNCAGVSPFSELLTTRTLAELMKPAPPTLTSASTSSICVAWNLTGVDVSPTFNLTQDTSISYRLVSEDGALGPSWTSVDGYVNGSLTYRACATKLQSFTFYQFRVALVDPTVPQPVSDSVLFQTLAEVPATPTKPVQTDNSDTTITITWSKVPTLANRSPVSLYLVDCAVANADAVANATSNTTSNETSAYPSLNFLRVAQTKKQAATITGLSPGTAYALRVIAVNAVGQSPVSDVLFTTTLSAVPSTVSFLNFSAVSSDSAKVTWGPAEPNGSPILSYTLEMFGGVNTEYVSVYSGLNTHRRVDALEPNVYYGFRVKATNAVGDGKYSDQIFVKTPMPGQALDEVQLKEASKPIENVDRHALIQTDNGFHPLMLIDNTESSKSIVPEFTPEQQLVQSRQEYVNPDQSSDTLSEESISGGDGSAIPDAPATVSVDGMCSVARGDCLEKDALETKSYYTCNMTTDVVTTSSTFLSCSQLDISKLTLEGDSNTLGPAIDEKAKGGCACACSGLDTSCGEPGAIRVFSGLNSAEECSQVICSFQKFSSCAWLGTTVSQGSWQEDSLVFTSAPIQSKCFENVSASAVVLDCPNGCGGFTRGRCLGNGTCKCIGGWDGIDCLSALCPLREHSCGRHGKCVEPNVCQCNPGYSGVNCDLYDVLKFSSNVRGNGSRIWNELIDATLGDGELWNETVVAAVPESHHHHSHSRTSVKLQPQTVSGSYVGIPYFENLDFSSNASFTVSLWFRASSTAIGKEQSVMLSHGNFRHGSGWGMGMLKGGYLFCAVGSSHEPYRPTDMAMPVTLQPFDDGRFHHLSCGYDGHRRAMHVMVDGNYIDIQLTWPYKGGVVSKVQGVLDISNLMPLQPFAPQIPLVVGASFSMSADFFDGEISEVRIWNVLRTPQEESQDMFAPIPESLETVSMHALVAYFGLNECAKKLPVVSGVVGLKPHTHTTVHVKLHVGDSHLPVCVSVAHPLVVADDSDLIRID
eukprot:c10051_g1_i1.p1 GENE.c10051_g1_i1~~c10051_g1_i1.p1  ORF type:complete len:1112 (+),score=335.01 c10051_g1_i1:51-3386(+)